MRGQEGGKRGQERGKRGHIPRAQSGTRGENL